MPDTPHTHIVQKGETLFNLADTYGIADADMILMFHNRNCPATEVIHNYELRRNQEILIPATEDIVQLKINIQEQNRIIAERAQNEILQISLSFKPQALHHVYHVVIRTNTIDEDLITMKESLVEYNIMARYKTEQQNCFIIELIKSGYKINGKEPSLKIDQLALSCSSSFYPMEIKLDKNGNYLGISNYKQILDRWIKIKANLLEGYQDKYALEYLEIMDQNIHRPQYIDKQISREPFIQSCFNAMYIKFYDGIAYTKIKHQYAGILYEVTQYIDKERLEPGRYLLPVSQEGISIDPRDIFEISAHMDQPVKYNGEQNNQEIIKEQAGLETLRKHKAIGSQWAIPMDDLPKKKTTKDILRKGIDSTFTASYEIGKITGFIQSANIHIKTQGLAGTENCVIEIKNSSK